MTCRRLSLLQDCKDVGYDVSEVTVYCDTKVPMAVKFQWVIIQRIIKFVRILFV